MRVLAILSHCVPLFTAKKLCSNFAWNKVCVMWGYVSLLILFILFYLKTYLKRSEIWLQTTLGRIWGHWVDIPPVYLHLIFEISSVTQFFFNFEISSLKNQKINLITKLIFVGYIGSKNKAQTRKKIKFDSKSIFFLSL